MANTTVAPPTMSKSERMEIDSARWQSFVAGVGPALAQRMVGQESGLWRRIAGGAFWSVAGTGVMNALTAATSVACARLLGSTRFGELAILLSTVNFFLVVASSGLGMTASRYIAGQRNLDPARAGRIIGLCSATALLVGLAMCGFCLLAGRWLSGQVLHAPKLAVGVGIAGAVLLFSAINASQTGILGGLEAFRTIAIGNLVRGASIALLVTAGAALFGLHGALLGYVCAGLATTIYYRIAIRRQCNSLPIPVTYRFEQEDFAVLYRFTLPVLVAALSHMPAVWWSNVLLARTSGYSEAGIFNAVNQCYVLILFFATATANLSLPTLSNVLADGDARKYTRCLAANFLITTLPAIVVAVPIAIGSRFIMGLYGPAFEKASNAVVLITISAVLFAISTPMNNAMWSLEAVVPAMVLSLVRGAVLVIAAYALAGNGAEGLVWANMIMSIVQAGIGLPWLAWLVRRRFRGATPATALVSWAAR